MENKESIFDWYFKKNQDFENLQFVKKYGIILTESKRNVTILLLKYYILTKAIEK